MTAEVTTTWLTPQVLVALIGGLPAIIIAIASLVKASKAKAEAKSAALIAARAQFELVEAKAMILSSMISTK